MSTFKKDFLSGTFYVGIAKYANIVCQLVITAILSRLLTPEDYGNIAIATVFIAFFNVLSDVGIGAAVIQRKDFTNKDLDQLYSLNIYIGVILSIFFFLSSGLISRYYDNEQLYYVCQLLSFLILFTCARTVPMNLLYREKKFKYIAFSNLFIHICCGIVAIITALFDWGVYSLVTSQVLSSFLLLIIYSLKYKRSFCFHVDLSPMKKIYSYSAYNFAGTIFIYFTLNIDKLLVGKFTGTKALGYYEKSYSLVFLPINNISFVITPVLHPLFSEFQNDFKSLINKLLKIIRILAFISFPLSVICFFISKELIIVFYGDQWYSAIPPFQIMCLAISFLILDTIVGSIYNAANETKRGFYTMFIMACIMIISVIVAIYFWNTIIAVAYAFLFAKIVGTLVNFYSLMQGLEGDFKEFLICISKPIIISLILAVLLFLFSQYLIIDNILIVLLMKSVAGVLLLLVLIRIFCGYNLIGMASNKLYNKMKR